MSGMEPQTLPRKRVESLRSFPTSRNWFSYQQDYYHVSGKRIFYESLAIKAKCSSIVCK